LAECRNHVRVRTGGTRVHEPDHLHRRLLRTRGEWPGDRRTSSKCDELPPPHATPRSTRMPEDQMANSSAKAIVAAQIAKAHQQTKTDDKIRGRRRSALPSSPAVIGNGWSFGSPPAKKSPGTNPRLDVSDCRLSRPAADGVDVRRHYLPTRRLQSPHE